MTETRAVKGTQPLTLEERRTMTSNARAVLAEARAWRMCRTCHRRGTTPLSPCREKWPLHDHDNLPVGICGQCFETRRLVECHHYDFRREDEARALRGAR